MVLMGEDVDAQFATLPGQACRSGWAVHGSYAPTLLWPDYGFRSLGFLPATCLASLSASALEPCSPAFLGDGLWSRPPGHLATTLLGLEDTALLARLLDRHALCCSAGSEWEGAPCPGWPAPPTPPHPIHLLPHSHPWPWLQLISLLWSQRTWPSRG